MICERTLLDDVLAAVGFTASQRTAIEAYFDKACSMRSLAFAPDAEAEAALADAICWAVDVDELPEAIRNGALAIKFKKLN